MYQSWRLWDGKSALTNMPDATPEALDTSYHLTEKNLKLVVYKDDQGSEGNVAVYPASVTNDQMQADFDAEVLRQKAAEIAAAEAAKQPTIESRVAALEAAQLAALGV